MAALSNSVLVVDDEPLIRMALASALEDEGYSVFEAGSVLQAVAVLSKHDIHAVVTDSICQAAFPVSISST
jgi:CheY-like chemotaxis protein